MDLQMPIMGGLAAMRAIRAWETGQGPVPTPMLAVSANATDEHVLEAKEAGADDHVAKPIVRETLFEAIARHASRPASMTVRDTGRWRFRPRRVRYRGLEPRAQPVEGAAEEVADPARAHKRRT